jgi:hypothetical protein
MDFIVVFCLGITSYTKNSLGGIEQHVEITTFLKLKFEYFRIY